MKTLIFALLISLNISAQQEDLKYASLNILSNSIIGGIGSGIHKKQGETFGHAFVQGVWKGAMSGAFQYSSKYLLKQDYIWAARINNSISSSMLYNTVCNEGLFSQLNVQFYFGYIEIKKRSINYKIDIITSLSTIYFSFRYEFDLKNTLKSGSIVFFSPATKGIEGESYGNAFWYKTRTELRFMGLEEKKLLTHTIMTPVMSHIDISYKTLTHEYIHTFQYNSFNLFSPIKHKNFNLNLNFGLIYIAAGKYKNNLFEKEADYFAN